MRPWPCLFNLILLLSFVGRGTSRAAEVREALTLAREGKTTYAIVEAARATEPER